MKRINIVINSNPITNEFLANLKICKLLFILNFKKFWKYISIFTFKLKNWNYKYGNTLIWGNHKIHLSIDHFFHLNLLLESINIYFAPFNICFYYSTFTPHSYYLFSIFNLLCLFQYTFGIFLIHHNLGLKKFHDQYSLIHLKLRWGLY